MTVHASSIIPLWLNSYNPTFYTAITSQENAAYISFGVPTWEGPFAGLCGIIEFYRKSDRSTYLIDFFTGLYSYKILNQTYGTSGTALAGSDATALFTMNGFMPASIGRANNYYNDGTSAGSGATATPVITNGVITGINITDGGDGLYEAGGIWIVIRDSGGGSGAFVLYTGVAGTLDTGTGSSLVVSGGKGYSGSTTATIRGLTTPKMTADINTVSGAAAAESAAATSLQTTYRNVVSPFVYRSLFDNVPTIAPAPNKAAMGAYVFGTAHYKALYQFTNTGSLIMPSTGATYDTLSPSDKHADITVVNNTATITGTVWRSGRASFACTVGSFQDFLWEVKINTLTADANHRIALGVGNSSASLSNYLGSDVNGWGWRSDGTYYTNAVNSGTLGTGYAQGDMVSVLYKASTNTLTFYKNGVSVGSIFTGLVSGTLYPMYSLLVSTTISPSITFNFGPNIVTPVAGYVGVFS